MDRQGFENASQKVASQLPLDSLVKAREKTAVRQQLLADSQLGGDSVPPRLMDEHAARLQRLSNMIGVRLGEIRKSAALEVRNAEFRKDLN